jgi:predicted YcjX-like family ATPase
MTQQEIDTINNLLVDQLDKIILLSTKEIIKSSDHEDSIEHLMHKLIKNSVKSIEIKKKILKSIRNNQTKDSYVI